MSTIKLMMLFISSGNLEDTCNQDYYGQDIQYTYDQHAEQQISGHDDKTFPIPVISQQRDTIITSHDQPPEQPICGHDEQTFAIPVISQRRDSIFASHDQPPEQQICGHDDKTSVEKNQSFCDLSNTDGYSENLSDCDADVESSGGECLEVTDPFGQQNMMGSQPSMDTGNVKSSGPPGTNENTVSTSVIQNIDLSKKHFVKKNEQDYDNLKIELTYVRLESYFPGGIVVKEGYDIFEIIAEVLPDNNVVELRSSLCKYLSSNMDYFGNLFAEEFEGKDLNIFDYIGKLIRNTTVPDHNAIFGLSKMLKQSFFIVGVRHAWKSAHTPNIDIVMGYVGNKKFYPVTLHKVLMYKNPV